VSGAKDSIGFALVAADRIGGPAGRAFSEAATSGFVDGFHAGLGVGAIVAAIGMIGVLLWLPARAQGRPGAAAAGAPSGDGAEAEDERTPASTT
jgi:hypothetical protein